VLFSVQGDRIELIYIRKPGTLCELTEEERWREVKNENRKAAKFWRHPTAFLPWLQGQARDNGRPPM